MQGFIRHRALVALGFFGFSGCVSVSDPLCSVVPRAQVRWGDSSRLDGRVRSAYEHGELLVWGTVEAPELRRGQVVGYADIEVIDREGRSWRSSRAEYREPVASDPPAAAAVYCARIPAAPPAGWHVVVTHHPRLFDAR